jgi:hypothetical protein
MPSASSAPELPAIIADHGHTRSTMEDLVADVIAGHGLTLPVVARRIPSAHHNCGQTHLAPSTLFRWATAGVRLTDGSILKLLVVRIGNRFLTTEKAVREFIAAQTRGTTFPTGPVPGPVRPTKERKQADAAADRQLGKLGI